MIELFSKKQDTFELKFDTGITPIHIDDSVVSLSAILLNESYYDLLVKGKKVVKGHSVIDLETVILFKIRAWLDMSERKEAGENIDSKKIKKHINDIFRLSVNMSPSSCVSIPEEIQNDVRRFIREIDGEKIDLINLGIRRVTVKDIFMVLADVFCDIVDKVCFVL